MWVPSIDFASKFWCCVCCQIHTQFEVLVSDQLLVPDQSATGNNSRFNRIQTFERSSRPTSDFLCCLAEVMCPFRVTIVGAGLTGSLTACRLKRIFKDEVSITLVEKSRGAGGRMSTNRFSSSKNRPNNLTCDLGAQYVSATPQYYEKHKRYVLSNSFVTLVFIGLTWLRSTEQRSLHQELVPLKIIQLKHPTRGQDAECGTHKFNNKTIG